LREEGRISWTLMERWIADQRNRTDLETKHKVSQSRVASVCPAQRTQRVLRTAAEKRGDARVSLWEKLKIREKNLNGPPHLSNT
jgi:hypothetical protein